MYRDTIYAGLINNGDLDKNVHFYGWVKNIRKLGSLIFMDVIDRYGYVQVVVDDKNKYFDEVYHTPIQSVVYRFVVIVVVHRKSLVHYVLVLNSHVHLQV